MKNESGNLSNAPKRPKDLIGAKIGESDRPQPLRACVPPEGALLLPALLRFSMLITITITELAFSEKTNRLY
jgi:hypothetical protein